MIETQNLVPTGASRIPNWASGSSYVIGDQVISTTNLNSYIRRTNGGGVTDPSADPTNWKPSGIQSTKYLGIVKNAAGFSAYPIDTLVTGSGVIAITYSSGALTANTLAPMFNFSGSISISQLAFNTSDATSRTMRIKVTVDGVVVFDRTSLAIATSGYGVHLAGISDANSATGEYVLPPIVATSSLLIEWASSLTETAKFTGYLIYQELQ